MLSPAGLDQLGFASIGDEMIDFVTGLYRELDARIADADSRCANCQLCCNFARARHRLFVTNIELAYFAAHVDRLRSPAAATCPYLDQAQACTVRPIRPIACRTYFCQPAEGYDPAQATEQALSEIKGFLNDRGLPYYYVEWLESLRRLTAGLTVGAR